MRRQVRYAVVGLGHIAQVAVLPAFANARRNSRLAALVSGDPEKLAAMAEKYGPAKTCGYDGYDALLASGEIDAVYLALPNSHHADYAVRAARAGIHVLCEKPMAVTEEECEQMAGVARAAGVRLMVAYRLHFERASLEALEIARSGRIGEPRQFNSSFTMTVTPDNIRVKSELGGGVLYDIGIYCINAARNLFRDEPLEVRALTAGTLGDVEESVGALLRFPNERSAAFICSFGAADTSHYRLVPTSTRCRCAIASPWTARPPSGASPSATSSPPSCCISRTACCTTATRSPRPRKASRTCASFRRSTARRRPAARSSSRRL
jgi:predicted dehydrogenase